VKALSGAQSRVSASRVAERWTRSGLSLFHLAPTRGLHPELLWKSCLDNNVCVNLASSSGGTSFSNIYFYKKSGHSITSFISLILSWHLMRLTLRSFALMTLLSDLLIPETILNLPMVILNLTVCTIFATSRARLGNVMASSRSKSPFEMIRVLTGIPRKI
jgi:hypothetical protein